MSHKQATCPGTVVLGVTVGGGKASALIGKRQFQTVVSSSQARSRKVGGTPTFHAVVVTNLQIAITTSRENPNSSKTVLMLRIGRQPQSDAGAGGDGHGDLSLGSGKGDIVLFD